MARSLMAAPDRKLPIGAEPLPDGGTHFRVWAPAASSLVVHLQRAAGGSSRLTLQREGQGYFAGFDLLATAGDLYRFAIGGNERLLPDPASRYQPSGPLGPSMIIDAGRYPWTDGDWPGLRLPGQVIYEMHVGTFTSEGTWRAASGHLPELADLGITALEIMPVHDFCGRYGWGYDGVDFFAPTRLYGTPDDFRSFVDRAHALGIGVILDVVYNHAGPAGSVLAEFAGEYFNDRYETDWGRPFNFDGPGSTPVREFFAANAAMWIDEYHLDGLRLDATQNIYDASRTHIITEIVARARTAAGNRSVLITAENEPQQMHLTRPADAGGCGVDALWNDDFHHSAVVALTGHGEAYYSDYRGTPQELVSAAKWGFLYQGQYYLWQSQRRGSPALGCPPARFIHYLENHDQVANLGWGHRLHQICHPGDLRALTALLLLGPQTPLLFQGQEYGSSRPFLFFADHDPELAACVKRGRFDFLAQFPSLASDASRARLPDPGHPRIFDACRLDDAERARGEAFRALHRDLLRLRREDPVFRSQGAQGLDGAVIGDRAFILRFFGEGTRGGGNDRLLVLNLGIDLRFGPAPEPLLAPPTGRHWRGLWSSEDVQYGGSGAKASEEVSGWMIPGRAAFVFEAADNE